MLTVLALEAVWRGAVLRRSPAMAPLTVIRRGFVRRRAVLSLVALSSPVQVCRAVERGGFVRSLSFVKRL